MKNKNFSPRKSYWLYQKDFCVKAVRYFYSTKTLAEAKKILGAMTQDELDRLYKLIQEFNNPAFVASL